MGILTYNGDRLRSEEVLTAAALSVVPGLGQIYNGEVRKGILFFCAGAASVFFLLMICLKNLLLAGAHYLGSNLHVRLNPGVLDCLYNLDMRSPQMLLLSVLLATFTLFCLKDAVHARQHLSKKAIYANEALAISEAASGSYLFHALTFASMFLLVLFLFVPPDSKKQITEIVFEPESVKTTKPVVTAVRTPVNSQNGGKARPKPAVNTPQAAQAPAAKAPPKQPAPPAKPAEEKAEKAPKSEAKKIPEQKVEPNKTEVKTSKEPDAPKPPIPQFETPRPSKLPALAPAPTPNLTKTTNATPTPPILQPTKTSSATSTTTAPQPLLAMAPPSLFGTTPAPVASSNSGKTAPMPGPAPAHSKSSSSNGAGPSIPAIHQDAGQQSGAAAPQPIPSSDGPSHFKSGKDAAAPQPHGAPAGATGHNSPVSIGGPVVLGPKDGLKKGADASPDVSNEDRPTSRAGKELPNYAIYMQELQRRIKRSWFPPRAAESKKTIVIFTIHQNGEISNVKLFRSSGDSRSDDAAIKAVENAAPFRELPPNSEDTIDVQFTFDYNLFMGKSSGSGMKF